jgi:hypothetical protein
MNRRVLQVNAEYQRGNTATIKRTSGPPMEPPEPPVRSKFALDIMHNMLSFLKKRLPAYGHQCLALHDLAVHSRCHQKQILCNACMVAHSIAIRIHSRNSMMSVRSDYRMKEEVEEVMDGVTQRMWHSTRCSCWCSLFWWTTMGPLYLMWEE